MLESPPVLARGLLGYTDGRRITFGTGRASDVEFATLAHETTHVLLHLPGNGGTPDTLDASLERIRATAQRLSTELDAIRFDAENDPRTV